MNRDLGMVLGFFVVCLTGSAQAQVLYTWKLVEPCGQQGSVQERIYDCSSADLETLKIVERSSDEVYVWQLVSMDPQGRQIWVESNSGLAVTSNNGGGFDQQTHAVSHGGNAVFQSEAITACAEPSAYAELKHGLDLEFRLPTKEDAEILIRAKVGDAFHSVPSRGLFHHVVRGGRDDQPVSMGSLPSWHYYSLWTSTIAEPKPSDVRKDQRRGYQFGPSGFRTVAPIDYSEGTYGAFTRQTVNFQVYSLFLCVAEIPSSELPDVSLYL